MATAIAQPHTPVKPVPALPGRRYDHYFFSGMALLMAVTVFAGFARTYYMAGIFHAPLPSLTIHLHGAVFTLWVLVFIAQTSLAAAGRVDIHRKVGIAGVCLACVMVVLGLMAATDSLVRGAGPPGRDVKAFYIITTSNMLIFAVLISFAFHARRDPATHKRLMLVASISLLLAAISRLPIAYTYRNPPHGAIITYMLLSLLIGYDLWATHKIHRATLWASAFVVFVYQIRVPIGKTEAWHAFATWAQTIGR